MLDPVAEPVLVAGRWWIRTDDDDWVAVGTRRRAIVRLPRSATQRTRSRRRATNRVGTRRRALESVTEPTLIGGYWWGLSGPNARDWVRWDDGRSEWVRRPPTAAHEPTLAERCGWALVSWLGTGTVHAFVTAVWLLPFAALFAATVALATLSSSGAPVVVRDGGIFVANPGLTGAALFWQLMLGWGWWTGTSKWRERWRDWLRDAPKTSGRVARTRERQRPQRPRPFFVAVWSRVPKRVREFFTILPPTEW